MRCCWPSKKEIRAPLLNQDSNKPAPQIITPNYSFFESTQNLKLTAAQQTKVNKQFIEAAKNGNFKKFEAALQNQAQTHALDSYGNTALLWAIDNGHLEIARILIPLMPPEAINAVYSNGTILMWTLIEGHLEIVRMLIQRMTPEALTAVDIDGYTAYDKRRTNSEIATLIKESVVIDFANRIKINDLYRFYTNEVVKIISESTDMAEDPIGIVSSYLGVNTVDRAMSVINYHVTTTLNMNGFTDIDELMDFIRTQNK